MNATEMLQRADQALTEGQGGSSATDILAGTQVGPIEDVLRSGGAGLRRGVESIAGTPQDLLNVFAMGATFAAGKLGATPEDQEELRAYFDIPYLPSTDDIHEFTSKVIGKSYEPQTTAGKYASSIAEGVGGAISNPAAGLARFGGRLALGALGGAGGETAGQLTEGTRYEPLARAAGSVAAGAAGSAGAAGVKFARTAEQRAAEIAAEEAAKRGAPDVQLTKGQRTGNIAQQQEEQRMLQGGAGDWAQRLMVARDEANKRATMEAATGIKDITAPSRGATPVDAGSLLNQQTAARAEQLRSAGGEKIQKALEAGVMLPAEQLRGLPGELSSKLEGGIPFVPDVILDSTTPVASQAMERVQKFVSQAGEDVQEVSMAGAEQLRRILGKLSGSSDTDNRALAKIRQYFDEWYDTAIEQHATIAPGGPRDPRDILADLKSGRAESKAGLDIVKPRGKPAGGATVADIGSGKRSAEETARLFKPNDAGNMSVAAIDAIDRLKAVGASTADLDQVRSIILEQLTTGDPGKVATRIDNFIKNNPTVAGALFEPDQLTQIGDWAKTNRALVPDPKAINPPRSGWVAAKETAKQGARRLTENLGLTGGVLGGWPGAAIGAAAGAGIDYLEKAGAKRAAKEALAPADRSGLTKTMLKGTQEGATATRRGALQQGQTVTVTDESDPAYGQKGRIIGVSKNGSMYKLRMPDGSEKVLGTKLVE